MKRDQIQVQFSHVVEVKENKRSDSDHRRKVDWILCSYIFMEGVNRGQEWRVAFEVPVGAADGKIRNIPTVATQNEIHAMVL